MTAHPIPSQKRRRLAGFFVCVVTAWGLTGCDANVQFTDEQRKPERVGATSHCDKAQRSAKGAKGEHALRVFLSDDNSGLPGTIPPSLIAKPPFQVKAESFRIASGEFAPVLLDADDGSVVKEARVTMGIVTREGTFGFHPNPRYEALAAKIANQRIPRAASLLIDMSEAAATHDARQTRLAVSGLWALENFNQDSTLGDMDILSIFFMRDGQVTVSDIFTRWSGLDPDLEYIAEDGRRRGFLRTAQETKEEISRRLNNVTPSTSSGKLPLYASIAATAEALRLVASDGGEALFLPGLVSLSVGMDQNARDAKAALARATQALQGKREGDFVPMMAITYPKASDITIDRWREHLDQLCQLAQAGGRQGQLFQMPPTQTLSARQQAARAALDSAYHAMAGYTALRVSYDIQGATAGKRYLVAFKLQATLLGLESKPDLSPRITFAVVP